jgi:hypothetical protein
VVELRVDNTVHEIAVRHKNTSDIGEKLNGFALLKYVDQDGVATDGHVAREYVRQIASIPLDDVVERLLGFRDRGRVWVNSKQTLES